MRKMKSGKAIGKDLILVEIWKCLGEVGLDWLTELFNVIFRTVKVVILTRVRLPTFGSPQTPCKRDHTGRCCCCCCTQEQAENKDSISGNVIATEHD